MPFSSSHFFFKEKLVQNSGTEGAPRGDGPSLKIHIQVIANGKF
jgi:hypothetical protein